MPNIKSFVATRGMKRYEIKPGMDVVIMLDIGKIHAKITGLVMHGLYGVLADIKLKRKPVGSFHKHTIMRITEDRIICPVEKDTAETQFDPNGSKSASERIRGNFKKATKTARPTGDHCGTSDLPEALQHQGDRKEDGNLPQPTE